MVFIKSANGDFINAAKVAKLSRNPQTGEWYAHLDMGASVGVRLDPTAAQQFLAAHALHGA